MNHRRSFTFPYCMRTVPAFKSTLSPTKSSFKIHAVASHGSQNRTDFHAQCISPKLAAEESSWIDSDHDHSGETTDVASLQSVYSFKCRHSSPTSTDGSILMTNSDGVDEVNDSELGLESTTTENSSERSLSSEDGYADDEGYQSGSVESPEVSISDESIASQDSASLQPNACWPRNPVYVIDGQVYPRTIVTSPKSQSDNKAIWKLLERFPENTLKLHSNRLVYDSLHFSKKARTRLTFKRPLSNEDYEVLIKRAKLAEAEN